jgi:hypothetical protein
MCAPFHGCSKDNIGGRGQLRRPEIVLQKEQTSDANIVYCWWKNLTPANSLSPVSLIPVRNNQKAIKFFAGVNDTAEKLFTGVNDTADKLFGGVNDTGD